MFVVTAVPAPVGTPVPAGCTTTSQAVSPLLAVQEISAVVSVTFATAKPVGATQKLPHVSTLTWSIDISPSNPVPAPP